MKDFVAFVRQLPWIVKVISVELCRDMIQGIKNENIGLYLGVEREEDISIKSKVAVGMTFELPRQVDRVANKNYDAKV